jgi:hypothetical protein
MKMANRAFENAAKFKYVGMAVIYQKWINEEIRSRLN